MRGLKQCAAGCGTVVTRNRLYCPNPDCQRSAEATRKRALRARKAQEREAQREAAAKAAGGSSEGRGGYASPWGTAYASENEMWADALLTGGLDGTLSDQERRERFRALSE